MSDYNWSKLDATLKRLEHHCAGLIIEGQPLERSRGCVLLPLAWLEKLVDKMDLDEARKNHRPVEVPVVTPPPSPQSSRPLTRTVEKVFSRTGSK